MTEPETLEIPPRLGKWQKVPENPKYRKMNVAGNQKEENLKKAKRTYKSTYIPLVFENTNQYQALGEYEVRICNVETDKLTRPSAMDFNEADVKKPLASAACVTRAGNRIVLDENGGFIENKVTGEKMKVQIENGVYVYEVQMESGTL